MIPEEFKEIKIYDTVNEWDLESCFLQNKNWSTGGYFNYGNDRGFGLSNGTHHSSITGDCLFDHITINGFKVYKNEYK